MVYLLTKVENMWQKGEIARLEQFVLFSHCFQKSSAAEASERVKPYHNVQIFILIS